MDYEEPAEEPEDWYLHDPELAWRVWTWMQATDGKYPPDVLLAQDEALMDDLATITWLHNRMKGQRGEREVWDGQATG